MATGQLYQLTTKRLARVGEYVAINGPWDSHGVVLKSTPKPEGGYLNLIRGVAPKADRVPTLSF